MQKKTDDVHYKIEDLSTVLRVQDLLLESRGSFDKHLIVPQIPGLTGSLQKGIYEILNAYQHRVSMPDWTGVTFLNYSYEQLTTIKAYFARFNRALQMIAKETPVLKQSSMGKFQLRLIEMCLKGNLDKMAFALKDTPWAQAIINLSFTTTIEKIASIPSPITEIKNGEMIIELSISPLLNMIADLIKENDEQDENIARLNILNQELQKENKLLKDRLPQSDPSVSLAQVSPRSTPSASISSAPAQRFFQDAEPGLYLDKHNCANTIAPI